MSRVRTGYEEVLAHRVSRTFAGSAEHDGVVTEIDPVHKVVKIRYQDKPVLTKGPITTPLSATDLDRHMRTQEPIYITVPGSIALGYKIGDVYKGSNRVNLTIAETIPYTDITRLPNYAQLPKSVKDDYAKMLASGQEQAIFYVRLDPSGVMTQGDVDIFQYGDIYTSVSGSHVRQTLVPNVSVGEKVKKGDIICYNSGFFQPTPDGKQVAWCHGIFANIALMEMSGTLEDASIITREFAKRLVTSPGHLRMIAITANTTIHEMVKLGDHVQTTDQLAVIEDADLTALSISGDPEVVELLNDLGRMSPTAKYYGTIAEIDVAYSCDPSQMTPSVRALVEEVEARKQSIHAAYQGTTRQDDIIASGRIPVGSKYRGFDFGEDTVIISIMISEELDMVPGSKLAIGAQLKNVVSKILPESVSTESGYRVDMLFGASGVFNRMVNSATLFGLTERVLEEAERQVVEKYFA